MTTRPSSVRLRAVMGVVLAGVLGLSGCISLLPKTKPAQLYRFGAAAPTTTPASSAASTFAVRLAPIGFPLASASDRLLTVDGEQAAYIKGGRWVTSAVTLFEGAVVQTFDSRPGAARLLARGELSPAAFVLKLDVRRFEARYEAGAGSPPTVLVEVYAALDNPAVPAADRQRLFLARVPAADNRIGPVAAAYDQAVRKVCADVVDWVDAKGA